MGFHLKICIEEVVVMLNTIRNKKAKYCSANFSEKTWVEWYSKRDHGVLNNKDGVLRLLRDVATSAEDNFPEALHFLQSSQWWIGN